MTMVLGAVGNRGTLRGGLRNPRSLLTLAEPTLLPKLRILGTILIQDLVVLEARVSGHGQGGALL